MDILTLDKSLILEDIVHQITQSLLVLGANTMMNLKTGNGSTSVVK